jgi:hypothetical protein
VPMIVGASRRMDCLLPALGEIFAPFRANGDCAGALGGWKTRRTGAEWSAVLKALIFCVCGRRGSSWLRINGEAFDGESGPGRRWLA